MARRAFVWGSNGSDAFGRLRYAEDDARRIAEVLSSPRYNFTITSPSSPGDPYQIKRELDKLAKSCREDDAFICYFSGHGELLGGELMLVLDETIPGDETTYLPVAWVKEARTRCPANNKLIILDCCHAGAAVGTKAGPIDIAELGLESKTEVMLLASRRLEIAREFEYLQGSFLTTEMYSFLVKAQTETVALSHLMRHLHVAVREHNQRASGSIPKVPIPFLNGNQQGEFIFSVATYPDLSPYVTIRDGGTEASVVSLAAITAMEISLASQGYLTRLSVRYLREKSRKIAEQKKFAEGELFAPVNFVMEHFGVPPESLWPYVPGKTEHVRGRTWKTLDEYPNRYRAKCFRLENFDEIGPHLEVKRPVLAGIKIHQRNGWYDSQGYGAITMPDASDQLVGVHAIVIVSRDACAYRFANTWGTGWGDQGLGTMGDATARALIERHYGMWGIEVPHQR